MSSDHVAEFTCSRKSGYGSTIRGGAEASKAEFAGTGGWKLAMIQELWRRKVDYCSGLEIRQRGIFFETI
jgi:hypothetical protein